ncbi:hypothetical protein HF1_12440 [Mycoplasma haemofelis str. Langford 1]|uniref:Uncharacterized protein n=1 Tax=Mycoplasma haemofelis (strain Langford 1) TaxID=941640 RepID=E8ZJD1_MYCHL|nr:hypothetical protein [Mycoplasma haemofelis]CBY93252.1 hypothetical protein HF1_12440 [Mycoplasma haemofelis str. Langford 1]
MPSKVKMGLAGGLASLISGSVGAYFGLEEKEDPSIAKVLSLDSQTTSRFGKCKVRLEGIGGQDTGFEKTYTYSEFYKEKKDPKGAIASACLTKLTEVDKSKENAVAVLKEEGDSYVFKEFRISSD